MAMRLFITGATGQIGRRLVLSRLARGDQVSLLSRDSDRASRLFAAEVNRNVTVVLGNPAAPGEWQQALAGCDAVIHLAGAGLADRRWNPAYKKTIVSSRLDSTRQVVLALEQVPSPQRPRILLTGSATGFYGDTGPRAVDETGPPGSDFLARLSVEWEQQARAAEQLGVRVVLLRTGIVLDGRGGALPKMMRPFRFFVGGTLGSGRQLMPWIHWRDMVGLIDLALSDREVTGPLNCTAPEVVTNREFAATLGNVMGRPSWLPAPRFALRLALGELATYMVKSQGVNPAKALARGYRFVQPRLEGALESLLHPVPEGAADSQAPQDPPAPAIAAASGAQPEAAIRLAAIAVDGTLLRSDGSLSQGVVQACRAAQRAGCVIVLATARPPRGMRSILQSLDLASPTINYNGAVIWNPLDEKPQYHESIPGSVAAGIIRAAREIEPSLVVAIEALDRWYTDRLDPRFEAQTSRLMRPDYIGPLESVLGSPVTKLSLIGAPEQLKPVLEMVRERYWKPRQVAVFLTDPCVIQITHALVDKGIALQRIANKLGVGREQVMALGDSVNDAGMIEWAGFGVAMGNASPAVRSLANAIIATNDEQGAALALQRYVLAGSGRR